jgi:cell division septation protein DedD
MNPADDALKDAAPVVSAVPVPVTSANVTATDGLSAAYAANDDAPKVKAPVRYWLWVLLVLLILNTVLWFAFTSDRSVWGQHNEPIAQNGLSTEKIVVLAVNAAADNIQNNTQNNTQKSPAGLPTQPTQPTPVLGVSNVNTNNPNINTPSVNNPIVKNKPAEKTSCMVWAFSNAVESKRANNKLAEQAWGGYTTELAEEAPSYMVFVGPFTNQKQTETMIKAINTLKIKDYVLLPSGAISLGVVQARESAQALQRQLSNRGLKGMQITERQGKNKLNRYRFEQMSPSSEQALRQLSDGLGALTNCAQP